MPDLTQAGNVLAVQDLLSLREDAYRLAARVSNTTDAEDIVHDAYVRAIQAPEIPADKGARRLWFLRVVVNAAHTHGQNDKHALDTVHGRTSGNSPASVNGKLDNCQSYKVVVQVRKKSVKVFLDNKMILYWPTDFNEFTIEGGWAIQSGNIGIGSYEGSATFKRVQIKELSAPPPLKTNAPPASEF